MSAAITVEHLYVSYHGNEAIKDVSFSLAPGNLVGVIGPNGAGKSTLLKALLDLIPKDKGNITYFDKSIAEIRKQIAYVPQRNDIDWTFPITVLDTVLLGTYPKLGLFRRPKKEQREWAYQCLERVGMEAFSRRQIGELSGGQQQRVFLARALAQQSEIFFLDEPFVGVDLASEETIIAILKQLKDSGKTIIVVHHDLNKASAYFNQLILLNRELISFGPVEDVFRPDILARAYRGEFSFMKELGVGL
ncbi:ABC transporter ATP-binding protein [Chlamydia abortus]|uniref:Metal ABC transporter ATP-binding protein n=1 Tax=Paenibacillus residui TaxID=629724 RepID=A0ABW3DD15_9BACL|nr:metal ABC transporter ATP-binding protein [Paenibacillus sp. 32O-W]SHE09686.1 ABC transporter ATP-binding protein [Chlamydia abortus]